MNKKTWLIVGIVFAVILVLAAGGMFFQYSKSVPSGVKPTATVQKPTENQTTTRATILSLLSGGKTVSCVVTSPDNKGSGAFFVADKKFAGDFNTKDSSGKEVVAHLVSDGTYIYIWSQTMPTGVKMNLEAAKSAASNAQANQSFNVNQSVDMKCGPWIADNSKFTLPTNVSFTDVSKFFPQGQPTTAVTPQTGTGTSTALCDQITNPTAKAACLKALQ